MEIIYIEINENFSLIFSKLELKISLDYIFEKNNYHWISVEQNDILYICKNILSFTMNIINHNHHENFKEILINLIKLSNLIISIDTPSNKIILLLFKNINQLKEKIIHYYKYSITSESNFYLESQQHLLYISFIHFLLYSLLNKNGEN